MSRYSYRKSQQLQHTEALLWARRFTGIILFHPQSRPASSQLLASFIEARLKLRESDWPKVTPLPWKAVRASGQVKVTPESATLLPQDHRASGDGLGTPAKTKTQFSG